MGGGSSYTIGYEYYLGLHLIIGQGPIDAILQIDFEAKTAWRGQVGQGRLSINKPTLFGEKNREGGVSGDVDILMGADDQGANDYLVSRFGADQTSGFRGLASLVFRQTYLGNSSRLPPPTVKALRVYAGFDNWLPEIAGINPDYEIRASNIYITMDGSGSMAGQPRAAQFAAVVQFLESLRGEKHSIKIVLWSDAVIATEERFNCGDADYDYLISWVEALPVYGGGSTNYEAAVSLAAAFFTAAASDSEDDIQIDQDIDPFIVPLLGTLVEGKSIQGRRKVIIFTSDGQPEPPTTLQPALDIRDTIAAVEVFCYAVNSGGVLPALVDMDNTPQDGIPIVTTENPNAIAGAFLNAWITWLDMNPVHILREILISPQTGGSGNPDDIGATFATAAQTIYDEGFGLSFFWQNPSDKDQFRKLVENHIDAKTYIDRASGKWEITLIRDDYVVSDLPLYNDDNVTEFIDVTQPNQVELPNQVSVTYTDRNKDDVSAVTLYNGAAVQMVQGVIPEKRKYEGITLRSLAARVCERDLVAATTPLYNGAMRCKFFPSNINLGSPFRIQSDKLKIPETVVRALEIEDGDGKDYRTWCKFVEDQFSITDSSLIGDLPSDVPVKIETLNSDIRTAQEAPYYLQVAILGQSTVDDGLITDDGRGYWFAAAAAPNVDHKYYKVARDAGGGYVSVADQIFAAGSSIVAPLSAAADAVTADIFPTADIVNISQYDLALIGSELVRVDAVGVAGPYIRLTLGRGCLDTIPKYHAAGSSILFIESDAAAENVPYTDGETVNLKLRNVTEAGALPLAQVPTDSVVFASRAIRPYRPGNFKADGAYTFAYNPPDDVALTWSHRDRTVELGAVPTDYSQGSIGPEAGVTYQVQVEGFDAAGASLGLVIDTNVGTATSYNYPGGTALPPGTIKAVFRVKSLRGIYENWQSAEIEAYIGLIPPGNLSAVIT